MCTVTLDSLHYIVYVFDYVIYLLLWTFLKLGSKDSFPTKYCVDKIQGISMNLDGKIIYFA